MSTADPQAGRRRARASSRAAARARRRRRAASATPATWPICRPPGPGVRAMLAADPRSTSRASSKARRRPTGMILEAFWKGDLEAMRPHVDGHVFDAFAGAVEQRKTDGLMLDNRLVAIEQAVIAEAELERKVALVTVRFEADIAAVTRNADGEVVAGSLSDAVQTRDLWTFRRDIGVARSQLAADRNRRRRVSLRVRALRARRVEPAARGLRRRARRRRPPCRPRRSPLHPRRSHRRRPRRSPPVTAQRAPTGRSAGRAARGRCRPGGTRAGARSASAARRWCGGSDASGPDRARRLAGAVRRGGRRGSPHGAPAFSATASTGSWSATGEAFATGYYEPEIRGLADARRRAIDVPIYRTPARPRPLHPRRRPDRARADRRERAVRALFHARPRSRMARWPAAGSRSAMPPTRSTCSSSRSRARAGCCCPTAAVMRIGYDNQNGREYVAIGRAAARARRASSRAAPG